MRGRRGHTAGDGAGATLPTRGFGRSRRVPLISASAVVAVSLVVGGCSAGAGDAAGNDVTSQYGTERDSTGTGPMVAPTIPATPSAPTDFGTIEGCRDTQSPRSPAPTNQGCTRIFRLAAEQFTQQIANFPVKTATVWGYNGSTPGPTLVSYAGEQVQFVVTNKLPEPTTVHPHGLHQPNADDGVPAISQPTPIMPGQTYAYPPFTPGHIGSFSYHSHFSSAVEELRGLDGMWTVLPRAEHQSVHIDHDLVMTLQEFSFTKENELVKPFPPGTGDFDFFTINGKTGDASGGPITIEKGERIRIRLYNASQEDHSMHLHGQDEVKVSKNGHANSPVRETTEDIGPGNFSEIIFIADNPGNWVFHCHFPHHTGNMKIAGYLGAPVGMLRVFHYAGSPDVPAQYFSDAHYKDPTT